MNDFAWLRHPLKLVSRMIEMGFAIVTVILFSNLLLEVSEAIAFIIYLNGTIVVISIFLLILSDDAKAESANGGRQP